MAIFEKGTIVRLGRNVSLFFYAEGGVAGLGAAAKQLKSRLGRSSTLAPSHPEQGAATQYRNPAQVRSELAQRHQNLKQARRQLARKSRELEQAHQQLVSKDQEAIKLRNQAQKLEQARQQLVSKNQELEQTYQQLARNSELVWQMVELGMEDEGSVPIPPPHEIFLVAGTENTAWFLKTGELAARSIRKTLEKNGLTIEEFDSILDFGCGVGRITRHWSALEKPDIYGTDYNPELIAWCQKNLTFAQFQVNDLVGKLSYENEKFDFIYAWSVFTHLTEAQQYHWIEELSRVLQPGGYLFITTHGDYYLHHLSHSVSLPQDEEQRFRNGNLVVIGENEAGSNQCAAYHPKHYVRETLARSLDVIDFVSGGAHGSFQDVYLLRKPSKTSKETFESVESGSAATTPQDSEASPASSSAQEPGGGHGHRQPAGAEGSASAESKLSADEVRAEIAKVERWYHRIEVAPGVVTPGINDSDAVLAEMEVPEDLTGKRVLDVGVRDGYFSFIAERRGAEVLAVDYVPPHRSGFAIASSLLNSSVEYKTLNVYSLNPENVGTFDVIFFLGVLYHLRDPMLALDRLWEVARPGATIWVESHAIDHGLVDPKSGEFRDLASVAPELVDVPMAQFYPQDLLSGDATNWWGPNLAGLRAMVSSAGFEVVRSLSNGNRGLVVGRRTEDTQTTFLRNLDRGTWDLPI